MIGRRLCGTPLAAASILLWLAATIASAEVPAEAERRLHYGVTAVKTAKTPEDFRRAAVEFEAAIAAAPRWLAPYASLALLHESLGDPEKAVSVLRSYLAAVPDDPDRSRVQDRIDQLERGKAAGAVATRDWRGEWTSARLVEMKYSCTSAVGPIARSEHVPLVVKIIDVSPAGKVRANVILGRYLEDFKSSEWAGDVSNVGLTLLSPPARELPVPGASGARYTTTQGRLDFIPDGGGMRAELSFSTSIRMSGARCSWTFVSTVPIQRAR